MKPEPIDWDLMEHSIAEAAFPGYLMYLASKEVVLENFVFRQDAQEMLNNATMASFKPIMGRPDSKYRVAVRLDELAIAALRKLNPNENIHALYVSAMLSLVLVDEGLYADPTNVSIGLATLLLEDLKEDRIEGTMYGYNEKLLTREAKKILKFVQNEGLYNLQLSANPAPEKSALN